MRQTQPKMPLIEKAIGMLGSERRLADALGCSQPLVNKMKWSGRCSPVMAKRIHEVTNGLVPKWGLRPDIWDPPAKTKH